MKHGALFILAAIFISLGLNAQQTLILQPGAEEGKDALIHALYSRAHLNYGDDPQYLADAWTYQGEPAFVRSLVAFDLSTIPPDAIIQDASLSLYAWNSDESSGPHSQLSGYNNFFLERITSDWQEMSVCWNSRPETTTENQILMAGTNDPEQDYPNINVTRLVQDMVNDPEHSFGFMIRLQNEGYFRRMNFCSSDHSNATKHPKLIINYFVSTPVDSCIVMQPNPEAGKDALLVTLDPNENYGDDPQFLADAWTNLQDSVIVQSLIEFDLSEIPSESSITAAYLSLYAWNSNLSSGSHSQLSGSNDFFLERVTSDWQEMDVCWNLRPTTTEENHVLIAGTDDPAKDYENIDVTQLVQDMIDNPESSFGFMIRLQNEEYYRRINFCSSDHEDATRWPKLKVCYSPNTQSTEQLNKSGIVISPNPTTGSIIVQTDHFTGMAYIRIFNYLGKEIKKLKTNNQITQIDLSDIPAGYYFMRIEQKGRYQTKKIIKL